MPPSPTTTDAFSAIADQSRRDILVLLAGSERSVSDIVDALELRQPSVSKHLKVLREVGLVDVRRDGRQAFYRTNANALKPVREWTDVFEKFWRSQLLRIKERAEK